MVRRIGMALVGSGLASAWPGLAAELIAAAKAVPDPVAEYGVVHARTAVAVALARPPVIDGTLDEELYRQPPAFSGFVRLFSERLAEADTLAWAGYDAQNLYLGARCLEMNPAKLRATVTQADDAMVWNDDELEIFVAPDHGPQDYYQFMVNANACVWDARLTGVYGVATEGKGVAFLQAAPDAAWNSGARAASGRETAAWTVEIAIPWQALGSRTPVVPGYSCAFNLCRHRIQVEETSNWSRLDGVGGNHNPRRFGLLVAGTEAPYVSVVQPLQFVCGTNRIELSLVNPTAQPVAITGAILSPALTPGDGKGEVTVPARGEGVLALACVLATPGARAEVPFEVRRNQDVLLAATQGGTVLPSLCLSLPRKDIVAGTKQVKAAVQANLGADELPGAVLRLDLVDKGGRTARAGEVRPLAARNLELSLALSGLSPGHYLLRGELVDGNGKSLGAAEAPLALVRDPLDF